MRKRGGERERGPVKHIQVFTNIKDNYFITPPSHTKAEKNIIFRQCYTAESCIKEYKYDGRVSQEQVREIDSLKKIGNL